MTVAHEEDIGLCFVCLSYEAFVASCDRIEAGAGDAEDVVAAPSEVSEGEVVVGELGCEEGFDAAVASVAFDECCADEYDAVAVVDFQGLGGRRFMRCDEHHAQ